MFQSALSRFVRLNTRVCAEIQHRLPWRFTRSLFQLQERMVALMMNSREGQWVLDIGGGRINPFARYREPSARTVIVGIDISFDQLSTNDSVDYRVVCDATRSIPLEDCSVDIIVTRSVLEHLRDNEVFFRECHRVLSPGGVCVHVFPGRFGLFAILNRILPRLVSRTVMNLLYPEFRGSWGFPAFYQDCYYPRIGELLNQAGFQIKQVEFRYYQSSYYRAFVPVFLVSLFYDCVLWLLDLRRLSSQVLIVGQKTR